MSAFLGLTNRFFANALFVGPINLDVKFEQIFYFLFLYSMITMVSFDATSANSYNNNLD